VKVLPSLLEREARKIYLGLEDADKNTCRKLTSSRNPNDLLALNYHAFLSNVFFSSHKNSILLPV
jgi:hypothetical protein